MDLVMQNAGKTISKVTILQEMGELSGSTPKIVEVCISYVRGKFESAEEPKLIRTTRGVGYQLGHTVSSGISPCLFIRFMHLCGVTLWPFHGLCIKSCSFLNCPGDYAMAPITEK